MDRKKEIIKMINAMSGSRSPYEVFCDWVKVMALGIQNNCSLFHDKVWQKREEDYLKTIKPYGEHGVKFVKMMDLLIETMEDHMGDCLGEIYMESGCGNKNTGQFFTPFHVSEATAKLSMAGADGSRVIRLNEPSCGGGGMVIAAAKVLQEKGINYQRCLRVVAQDLDWKAVYMCYVQLSFLGIDAIVVQGNTITEPYIEDYPPERIFRTPRSMGILL